MPKGTSEEELRNIQRGYLEAKSETDPDVRTSLMIYAVDPDDTTRRWFRCSVVSGDPRDHQWEDGGVPGAELGADGLQGFIPDVLARAITVGVGARHLAPPTTLEQMMQQLAKMGLMLSALVFGEDPTN
jgi:hypothetical protein